MDRHTVVPGGAMQTRTEIAELVRALNTDT
jgi:hypothetical protein